MESPRAMMRTGLEDCAKVGGERARRAKETSEIRRIVTIDEVQRIRVRGTGGGRGLS